mgnify:CR=1 FL=1
MANISRRLAIGVLIGMVLLLCGVCGMGAWLAFRNTRQALTATQQTANQLLQALQQHQWQAAQQYFTSQARTRFTPRLLQQRWQPLEAAIGSVRDWAMEDFRVHTGTSGQWVQLRYRLQGAQGVGTVRLQLRWVGKRWLVEEMEIGW